MDKRSMLKIAIGICMCFLCIVAVICAILFWPKSSSNATTTPAATTQAAATNTTAATTQAATTSSDTPSPSPSSTPAATTGPPALATPSPPVGFGKVSINQGNDNLANEDVVVRAAFNHNLLSLPAGSNKVTGMSFNLNCTGGSDIRTTDGTKIYVPAQDDSYNNQTATGVVGTSFHIGNNTTYTVSFDGSQWVIF